MFRPVHNLDKFRGNMRLLKERNNLFCVLFFFFFGTKFKRFHVFLSFGNAKLNTINRFSIIMMVNLIPVESCNRLLSKRERTALKMKSSNKILWMLITLLDFKNSVGYPLPFQHNELFHLPYMAVAEISLGISLRVRPEEPFLLLKSIITLSLILCSYY